VEVVQEIGVDRKPTGTTLGLYIFLQEVLLLEK
jgi:hypothetical protein